MSALQDIVDDLRRMRDACEPKSNENMRYHRYSSAVSALSWIIQDLEAEAASPEPDDPSGADRQAELARQFEARVRDGIPGLRPRYDPHRFLQLVDERGAVGAARWLLNSPGHTSYGFQRLYEIGRLDASIEFGALLPWFEDLFTEDERYEARTRLITHEFPLDAQLRAATANRPDWTWQV